MVVELRPYQKKAADWFTRAVKGASGLGLRRVIHLPTGTGKTVLGLSVAKEFGRTLWLAHRDELIEQPMRALKMIDPGAEAGIVKADRNQFDARDFVFASIQTACQTKRLDFLADQSWDLVVVDEVHHSRAKTWAKVIERIGGEKVPVLGLTATPERGDGKGLDKLYGGIFCPLPLLKAIREGWLVPFRQERVLLDLGLSDVTIRNGDFAPGELSESLLRHKVVEATRDAVISHCFELKTIVFCAGREISKLTVDALQASGVKAGYVDGDMPTQERRAVLSDFAHGRIQVLCNVAVLTEGYDQPDVGAVVIARPTRCKPLYVQMVGRGLRTFPGKEDLLIVDLVDNESEHDLIQATTLLGKHEEDERAPSGEKDEEAVSEEREDVWLSQIKKAYSRCRGTFAWVKVDGNHAIEAGNHGTIIVYEVDEGLWQANLVKRGILIATLTAEPTTLDWAIGVSEDFVRRVGAGGLAGVKSSWRRKPASPKQLDALKRFGINGLPRDINSGQASDLLGQRAAEKELRQHLSRTHDGVSWYTYVDPMTGRRYGYGVCPDKMVPEIKETWPEYPIWGLSEHAELLTMDPISQALQNVWKANHG